MADVRIARGTGNIENRGGDINISVTWQIIGLMMVFQESVWVGGYPACENAARSWNRSSPVKIDAGRHFVIRSAEEVGISWPGWKMKVEVQPEGWACDSAMIADALRAVDTSPVDPESIRNAGFRSWTPERIERQRQWEAAERGDDQIRRGLYKRLRRLGLDVSRSRGPLVYCGWPEGPQQRWPAKYAAVWWTGETFAGAVRTGDFSPDKRVAEVVGVEAVADFLMAQCHQG